MSKKKKIRGNTPNNFLSRLDIDFAEILHTHKLKNVTKLSQTVKC